jgi:hypothetical protein
MALSPRKRDFLDGVDGPGEDDVEDILPDIVGLALEGAKSCLSKACDVLAEFLECLAKPSGRPVVLDSLEVVSELVGKLSRRRLPFRVLLKQTLCSFVELLGPPTGLARGDVSFLEQEAIDKVVQVLEDVVDALVVPDLLERLFAFLEERGERATAGHALDDGAQGSERVTDRVVYGAFGAFGRFSTRLLDELGVFLSDVDQ